MMVGSDDDGLSSLSLYPVCGETCNEVFKTEYCATEYIDHFVFFEQHALNPSL